MKEIELLKIIFKDSPDILEPLNEIDKEIERLNNIINKAKEKSIFLQKRYGYVLDDLTYLLMQGSESND